MMSGERLGLWASCIVSWPHCCGVQKDMYGVFVVAEKLKHCHFVIEYECLPDS